MRLGRFHMAALFLASALAASAAFAQTPPTLRVVSEGSFNPEGTQRLLVHSDRLGRDFLVVVSAPPTSGAQVLPDLKLPVSKLPDPLGSCRRSTPSTAAMASQVRRRR